MRTRLKPSAFMEHNHMPHRHVNPDRSSRHRYSVLLDERRRARLPFSSENSRSTPMVCGKWDAGCHAILLLLRRSDVAIVCGSALLVLAALLALQGFRQFFHQQPSLIWEYGALGAILTGLVHWTYISPDVNARAALISGFLAYIRFGIAWLVQRYRPAGRPKYSYYFVSVAAVLGAIVHAVRCAEYALGLVHETTFLEATPINVAFSHGNPDFAMPVGWHGHAGS